MGKAWSALPASSRLPSFGGTSFWVKGAADLDSEVLAKAAVARAFL